MNKGLGRRQLLEAAARLPLLLTAGIPGPALGLGRVLAAEPVLSAHEAATLERMAWLLFPFPELGRGPYRRLMEGLQAAVSEDPAQSELVKAGILALDQLAGGAFVGLEESRQVELLREIEQGGFFGFTLEGTRSRLFRDRALWDLVGYEGSSLEFGGYLNRGLNDIDWLPEGPDNG